MKTTSKVNELIKRGSTVMHPESVFIDPETSLELISPDVVIYPSCRILGKETSIGPSCVIGREAPATIENCQLSDNVSLHGGFFSGATFLSGASCGSCSHVRPATLMEEQSSCAHAVGLKQTILFPFVTLGSLINFCDCFMAGGTDRKNHSEVGSSFIHFNYTPHQDKATPSLIGDVPRGVMLDQSPIFLGGQGGLAGPSVIEYGTVTAAGTICRKDINKPGLLVADGGPKKRVEIPYEPGIYGDISRIIQNNMIYIANIIALREWYKAVRSIFADQPYSKACHKGALKKINTMIDERLSRMSQLAENMQRSLEMAKGNKGIDTSDKRFRTQQQFAETWPRTAEAVKASDFDIKSREKDAFLNFLTKNKGSSTYIETIKNLPDKVRKQGTIWLDATIKATTSLSRT